MSEREETSLQVLISTYGAEGIHRIAKGSHPFTPGVEYIVSWQASQGCCLPDELLREDFKIYRTDTTGLSRNRNHSISKATAPLILISDDDVDYTSKGLNAVIEAFSQNPDSDILAFKYSSPHNKKNYPAQSVSISDPPKGYYITSIEIALRREAIAGKIWFNENFGIGATFPSGEEDVFIKDCLNLGLRGKFIPTEIARHQGDTTSSRNLKLPSRPQTKGAVFLHLHPHDWPLRMAVHALREIPRWRRGIVPSPLSYCINWIKGVSRAKKLKVFRNV